MMPGGGGASPTASIGTSVPPAHRRRMRPSSSLRSGRLTTASIRPCSRLDSARPKSRGQRLARRLLHDARAGEREQRVGLGDRRSRRARRTRRSRRPWSDGRAPRRRARRTRAADRRRTTVFAICMSASTFSCMRAPPEAATETSGMPRSAATSLARVKISPTTLPIEPPMNAKSMRAEHAGHALDRGGAGDHRVAEPRGHLGLAQALGVRAQIGERERIGRAERPPRADGSCRDRRAARRAPRLRRGNGGRRRVQTRSSGAQLVLAVVRLADRAGVRDASFARAGGCSRAGSSRSTSTWMSSGSSWLATGAPPGPRTAAGPMRTLVDRRCRHPSAPLGSSRMPARVNFTRRGRGLRRRRRAGTGRAARGQAPARDRRGRDSRGRDAALDPHRRRRARRALQHAAQGVRRARGAGLRDDAPRLGHRRARARRRGRGRRARASPTARSRARAARARMRNSWRWRSWPVPERAQRTARAAPARTPIQAAARRGARRRAATHGAARPARAHARRRCCRPTSCAARTSGS